MYVYWLRQPRRPWDVGPPGLNGLTTNVWRAVLNLMMKLAKFAVKRLLSLYLFAVDLFSLRVWMHAKVIKGAEIIAYTKQGIVVAEQAVTILARDVVIPNGAWIERSRIIMKPGIEMTV